MRADAFDAIARAVPQAVQLEDYGGVRELAEAGRIIAESWPVVL